MEIMNEAAIRQFAIVSKNEFENNNFKFEMVQGVGEGGGETTYIKQ